MILDLGGILETSQYRIRSEVGKGFREWVVSASLEPQIKHWANFCFEDLW